MRSPILAGELIHLSRSPRTWALRAGLAVFLASAAAIAWPWSGEASGFQVRGQALFQIFFWSEFVAGFVLIPAMVAPAIAWERERATLDLLSVAPVTDFDIVAGKLVANGALTAATLAAGLPVGVASLLLGGTTPLLLLTTTIGLMLHGFFAASISILMSASSDRAGTATGLALVTLIMFSALSAVLGMFAMAAVGGFAGKSWAFPAFSLLCPWSVAIRDSFMARSVTWIDRGLAWGAHLAEAAGALAIASTVLRNARSPRSRGGLALPPRKDSPSIPMAFFARPAAPANAMVPVTLAQPASGPPRPPAVAPPSPAFAPWRNSRLPISGNPVYWKDRAFDDSPARQVLTVFAAIVCGGSLAANGLYWVISLAASGAAPPAAGHFLLTFDLLIAIILTIGAGASTLGPERDQGTLPILLATGLPAREILRGKVLASLRSISPALAVALLHAAFAAVTLGRFGPLAAAAFLAGLVVPFTLACAASLAVGRPQRAAAAAAGSLFVLWAVPSLAALPFRGSAPLLTSLNPFGIILRSVSAASDGSMAKPHLLASLIFLAASAAIAAASLAGAVSALEARVRR
ncbi:MAG: ABC transporter permease subunit [Planctomycetota bacterium]